MTIYANDIKLFASKVMNDESDGGGAITGNVITSGEHNSMFDDVSGLDRTYGDVGIRSVHLKVDANTDETYYGATIGLSEKPVDENVEVTLMSVNDPYIERDETRNFIESYLTKGAKYQGELLYTQLAGQRAVRFIQRIGIAIPSSGDVLVLINKQTGEEQYIKMDEVSAENQTFTSSVNQASFTRNVVTCVITEPLRYEFVGVTPNIYDSTSASSAVYESMVADASDYFGLKVIDADAIFNSSDISVDSIYTQLVPSTRVDSAHVNQNAVNLISAVYDSGDGSESELITGVESRIIDVTIANQGYLYTATLTPIPSKGTTKVSFMAQGNWYELQDNGSGVLKGSNDAYGTGSIDEYGNLLVTCGVLPDVDVPIIIQYQNVNNYVKRMKDEDLSTDNIFTIGLGENPINSVASTMTWGDGKSATISNGVVSGDFVGEYKYKSGTNQSLFGNVGNTSPSLSYVLEGKFTSIPSSNTEFELEWEEELSPPPVKQNTLFSMVRNIQSGGVLNLPANLPVGSLKLKLTYHCSDASAINFVYVEGLSTGKSYPYYGSSSVTLLDDGQGQLIAQVTGYPVAGTINYATGVVTLVPVTLPFVKKNWIIENIGDWKGHVKNAIRVQSTETNLVQSADFVIGTEVSCIGYDEEQSPSPVEILAGSLTASFSGDSSLNLSINTNSEVLDDSVVFEYNGREYECRDNGEIYYLDSLAGSLQLSTGEITINQWNAGTGSLSLIKGVFKTGVAPETQYTVFRTAGSPVASQSLQVNATGFDGGNVNATTDADGNITSPTDDFGGTIKSSTGVVELFASGLLDTESLKYNCVSYNYLPLDADLLGLDPIRLPSDGRVVIFKKGNVVVIHQDEELTQAVSNGQTLDLGEVRLESCTTTAIDAQINLDAGTIYFPTGGTYDIKYRFEDMVLLTYVDISGALKTSQPLSHNYTAGKAKVASLLIAGDMFARYTNLFDQSTWTGVFSKNLIGNEAAAQYNDTLYPIVVTDDGCITEEFAIVFTSSTTFKLIGANVGQIATGNTSTDFSPTNPTSGTPYFTLDARGWGTGWSTNNVLRIDFYGATYQLNVIRTVLQGESSIPADSDKFTLQFRGNVNK